MAFEKMSARFSNFASEMAQQILRQVESEVEAGLDAMTSRFLTKGGSRPALNRNGAAKVASLAAGNGPKNSKGRKLNMDCRIEGCENRSRGPKYGFMCEKHESLPKKEQEKARIAWNEKRAKK